MGAKPVSEFSAKSRNHHRAILRQLFLWAVRKDYLPASHRLGEADALRAERANTSEIEFYSPSEFQLLLKKSDGTLKTLIAIGGLAGLRTAELLALTWEDVHKVPGHIEISTGKAKTRQRRLVVIVDALRCHLDNYKSATGRIWLEHEVTFHEKFVGTCQAAQLARKQNGLRHAFCTFHLALHNDEQACAMQAGNSPVMIHGHYKGLATKSDAEHWFSVSTS